MPPDVTRALFSDLSPRELVGVAAQCRSLACSAFEPDLWERHCRQRWPNVGWGAHGAADRIGDWCSTFRRRAAMPIGFPLACDAIAGVTIHCAESPCAAQSFPGLLRDLATVATCMEGNKHLRDTPEFRLLQENMTWWLAEHPGVVMATFRRLSAAPESASHSHAWHGQAGSLLTILQWLKEHKLLARLHPSVSDRIQSETLLLQRQVCAAA